MNNKTIDEAVAELQRQHLREMYECLVRYQEWGSVHPAGNAPFNVKIESSQTA